LYGTDETLSAGKCDIDNRELESMDTRAEVLTILEAVLSLKGRSSGFANETRLLGGLPELDSMAVVDVLTALEERFGFVVADDEIDGAAFATVGSLVEFVRGKLG